MTSYDVHHPKGNKYSEKELRLHRDRWFSKVAEGNVVSVLPDGRSIDQDLLRDLRQVLPWEPCIKWLTHHDFGARFRIERLDPLKLIDYDDDPSREFLNMELEAMRGALRGAICQLLEAIATNCFAFREAENTELGLSER